MNRLALFLVLAVFSLAVRAEENPPRRKFTYPPSMEGASVETYKEVDGTALKLWIFQPAEKSAPAAKRPAIVFFFGGGWTSGSPSQFESQCRHFAERGMVAITADYRVASRQHVKPTACVADAKSCLRWVRKNADRLGIDPDKIVAAGGSAGGHLAAATATLPGMDEAGEDTNVSAVPNALVLFNPALALAPFPGLDAKGFESKQNADRFGCPPEAISPIHHVGEHLPPMLILHGKADTTVPYASAEAFATEMKKKGNRCDLVGYEGQTHGFFNAARYNETVAEADQFLVSLGYLPPQKTNP
ncbi:Alpha/beta hydrolase fold-3 domain protein [Chthoniobacter flavus Ellin428]|uniref:Alpha/beta hydrolase fold-3 domain protein n=1 Tax=Chthoniobacter flavus Ellin428 TaxID=497964 RepID=B4D0W1_9BACT|nr:alpha/beta hydrolase [Chthoniobacter flavus]EDY19973.1 Alpha/beta hydrolase fold-3 domain protein [Chthoniobacter flavus Ellin428]TCO91758.1 acetyl esterase/lipase [Chthoniobacter flavus]